MRTDRKQNPGPGHSGSRQIFSLFLLPQRFLSSSTEISPQASTGDFSWPDILFLAFTGGILDRLIDLDINFVHIIHLMHQTQAAWPSGWIAT